MATRDGVRTVPLPFLAAPLLRRYRGAKVLGHLRLSRRARDAPPPVLVHQMGKVASQAVTRSIEQRGLPVYQTHFVTRRRLKDAERVYRRAWDPGSAGRSVHVWQGQRIARQLRTRPELRWRVVSIVRDPVARNLSSFFQVAGHQYGLDLAAVGAGGSDEAVRRLRELFLDAFDEHDLPLRWIEEELEGPFAVDVYGSPFPHERGYATYRGARADVLVVRYEDLARVHAEAVGSFLALSQVELPATNVSRGKDYGRVYDEVSRRLQLPADYLDRMYGSRYARHFYSEQELTRMRQRWAVG